MIDSNRTSNSVGPSVRSGIALSREGLGQKITPSALPTLRRQRAAVLARVLLYGSFSPEILKPRR